jgi:acetoin utilization deacetylase AcuC-like enzyme
VTTLLLSHSACLEHATPSGHPECSDRLRAIEHALVAPAFDKLLREEAPRASQQQIALAHPLEHIASIFAATPDDDITYLDADTVMSPGSLEAALRAAGAAIAAVDAVASGRVSNAFCATRPPGHHAEATRAMGFCLFNNAAIAARHAQKKYGFARIAIIDWDVHHGNGIQDIFWSDPSVLYISTHEMPLYPGTGAASERGDHDNILNIPLQAGDGSDAFKAAFEDDVLPRVRSFSPDMIIISAGFDAHRRDPLGGLELSEADFAWATRALMKVADETCHGRIVSLLEGGYDLQALGASVAAHVKALMQSSDMA